MINRFLFQVRASECPLLPSPNIVRWQLLRVDPGLGLLLGREGLVAGDDKRRRRRKRPVDVSRRLRVGLLQGSHLGGAQSSSEASCVCRRHLADVVRDDRRLWTRVEPAGAGAHVASVDVVGRKRRLCNNVLLLQVSSKAFDDLKKFTLASH